MRKVKILSVFTGGGGGRGPASQMVFYKEMYKKFK